MDVSFNLRYRIVVDPTSVSQHFSFVVAWHIHWAWGIWHFHDGITGWKVMNWSVDCTWFQFSLFRSQQLVNKYTNVLFKNGDYLVKYMAVLLNKQNVAFMKYTASWTTCWNVRLLCWKMVMIIMCLQNRQNVGRRNRALSLSAIAHGWRITQALKLVMMHIHLLMISPFKKMLSMTTIATNYSNHVAET